MSVYLLYLYLSYFFVCRCTEILAKRKRASKRAMCEELVNELEKGLSLIKDSEEDDKTKMLAGLLGGKRSLLDLKKELVSLDDDYISLVSDDDEADSLSRDSAQLYRIIQAVVTEVEIVSASAGQNQQRDGPRMQPISVKLPKLEIKKFSGNPSHWRSFWDSFQAAVGKHSHIEDVEKFNFLKGLLEGKAAMAISGLELSNENYKEAVSLLSDRFGSKQVVITHHMDTLLQIVPVKIGTDVKQLRAIYDKIEVNVRGLQSLGIKPDQYGCLLVPVIMSKVPEDIRLIILRQFSSEKWTFEVLLKCFKQELEAREKCVAVSKSSRKEEVSKGSDHGSGNGGSSRALNTNSNTGGEGSGVKCTFCKDSHPSVKCDIVKDVDSRWSLVKRKHLCFLCLRSGHGSQSCNSKTMCKRCGKKHHISLCKEVVESNGLITNVRASTLLQTAKVKAFNSKTRKHVFVRVVFDMGSNDSYITDRLKKRLSLPTIGWQKLRISGFGGASNGSKSYPMTSLTLRSRFGGDDLPFSAFSVPKIASSINPSFNVSKLGKLACLDLADDFECDSDDEIDLLVGVDQYHRFVTGETKRQTGGPVATHSVFGWLVSGPYGGAEGGVSNSFLLSSIPKATVDEDLARIWEIENFGLEDEGDEERLMVERFKSNIVHDGKRYVVSLPRKEIHDCLPDNIGVAKQRLFSLKKRLDQSPDVRREYDAYFQDHLERGIIEKVSDSDPGEEGWTHYLPHHCVIREDKETTKMRVVFDASCSVKGSPSLNKCLDAGPSLNPELFDILLRFRSFPIALIADIEKAFLMISVRPEDRNVLRFLWFDPNDPEKIVIFRQTRVTFGLNASPFILTATIRNHLEKFVSKKRETVEVIEDSLYVDDLCGGEFDDEGTLVLYEESKEIMKDGSFNLRKWRSNSESVRKEIEKNEGVELIDDGKVLGIPWNSSTDTLRFELDEFSRKFSGMKITKRNVVSVIAQLFDPLGLLSPIFIIAKVLLQKIHKSDGEWDTVVIGSLADDWNKWLLVLKGIEKVEIPRFYFHGVKFRRKDEIELHGFSDASGAAYGAVVYVLNVKTNQPIIVTSKSKVAPLKETSIPRLELLGALVLSKLILRVRSAMERLLVVTRIHCWTDSMVVLYWLNSKRDLKQFVRNRVNKIKDRVEVSNWKHCPGKENPSDLLTRGT